MAVKPVPDGYRTATPYLTVEGASDALAFYKEAFDATEVMRLDGPGGKVMHAEFTIGDSRLMISDAFPDHGAQRAGRFGGSALKVHLYVEDVDATVGKAVASGAKVVKPVMDMFYGDRSGVVEDPFGHTWNVATHVEDVTPEQMDERFAAMMAKMAKKAG